MSLQFGIVPEQLPQVPGNSQTDVGIHIDLGDAQLGNFLQLLLGDAVGIGDGAAQLVDLLDNVLGNRGRTVGNQSAEQTLVTQALLGSNGDLLADLSACALVGAVLGAVGNGQSITAGDIYRVLGWLWRRGGGSGRGNHECL